ncbi:hypothetical protein POTOM_048199 [Populus tomentosa]|uniref:Uncharacterized protein n=1 Tax=Populus tomentosa TaxID=118781 RepID=A0A8X8CBM6_POPTO|nr:hypothetical protein POTOM_048199 [Populus tomentosa]
MYVRVNWKEWTVLCQRGEEYRYVAVYEEKAEKRTRYVPSNYIRPVSDRPKLSEVLSSDGSVPLIDLQGLEVGGISKDFTATHWKTKFMNGQAALHLSGTKDVAEYCRNARELSLRLLEAISESLCLETDYISKALSKHG